MENLEPKKQDGDKTPPENDEKDVELSDDDYLSLDEDTSTKFRSLDAQRHKYKTRALEAEKKKEELEKQIAESAKKSPEKKEEKKTKTEEIDDVKKELATIKLTQKYPDLDDEDIKLAFLLAEKNGKEPKEIVGETFFQAYLKDKADKKAAAGATPAPSNRGGQGAMNFKEIVKNPKLIAALSEEQLEKFNRWKEEQGL